MPTAEVNRTIDAVWRIESARLIAGLARLVRDVGLAEDLAQEALVAALEQWPESGVPDKPGAWLMATGRHRAIDRLRRAEVHERKTRELGREVEIRGEIDHPDLEAEIDDPFDDDLLRLVYTTCHPVLSTDARVALTLRLLGGLTTKEIASAYLVSESTVAQRIVRAKRTLSAARVPFDVPAHEELADRLASVLEVIYLIFNEGYAATAGDDWIRTCGGVFVVMCRSEPWTSTSVLSNSGKVAISSPVGYFTVSLATSSIVVTPSITLCRPLRRSVIIPSSTAFLFNSSADAPTRINSRSSSVISMTSYKPTRPL